MNRNITALILIALAIGIYFTFTKAKIAEVHVVKEVNARYASAIDNADRLIKLRDNVLKQYNAIDPEDRERLDKMVPNNVDNIRLIIDVNTLALKHGFSLKNVRTAAGIEDKKTPGAAAASSAKPPQVGGAVTPDIVTMTFSVAAPYQKFIEFLQELESSLRIMDVTHLSVTASETGVYDFGVELKTYWLRQ